MSKDIQQAESAIQAGDTKTGFEILKDVLAQDPNSERAWWIMSGLVQREERVTCLEQVLRINPNNQLAQDALDGLISSPPQEETKPPREIPQPLPVMAPPIPVSPSVFEEGKLQTWLHARGSKFFLTILGSEDLIKAQTDANLYSSVRGELKKGEIPDQLFTEMQTIPLSNISTIRQQKSDLVVFYKDGTLERNIRLRMADQPTTDKVMEVIKIKLGPDFILKTQPTKTGLTMGISTILTLGTASLTAYLFWVTQEVVSGRAETIGSVNSQFLIDLVGRLGPGGLVLIGLITLMVALGISAWLLLKPPTITELTSR